MAFAFSNFTEFSKYGRLSAAVIAMGSRVWVSLSLTNDATFRGYVNAGRSWNWIPGIVLTQLVSSTGHGAPLQSRSLERVDINTSRSRQGHPDSQLKSLLWGSCKRRLSKRQSVFKYKKLSSGNKKLPFFVMTSKTVFDVKIEQRKHAPKLILRNRFLFLVRGDVLKCETSAGVPLQHWLKRNSKYVNLIIQVSVMRRLAF